MLSGSLFSHHQGRFEPSRPKNHYNHFIKCPTTGTSSMSMMSSTSSKTRDHLAADVLDPRTPTLRRYAKFNMSTNFASNNNNSNAAELPLIKIELLDDDDVKTNAARSNDDGYYQEPLLPPKSVVSNPVSRKVEQNWLLLDRGVDLQSASLNRNPVGFGRLWMDEYSKKKSSATLKGDKHLTLGNLKLFKSNIGVKPQQCDPVSCDDHCCCHCAKPTTDDNRNNGYCKTLPSNTKVRASILPRGNIVTTTTSTIKTAQNDCPKIYESKKCEQSAQTEILLRSPTSTSCSSKSSNGSQNNNNTEKCHLSCPDLLEPCINRDSSSDSLLNSTLNRNKKKKNERKSWKCKLLEYWTLDDVLLWLQSVGLEEVTSVLIGYDISGSDVEKWNHTALIGLGITDNKLRSEILSELQKLKSSQAQNSPRLSRKSNGQRCYSLFPLINDSKYNAIMTVELPYTTSVRDFTVATDPSDWALVVTSCKPNLSLAKGDLIIEMNGVSCIKLPPVDFNKILHEFNGHKYQLVVLRKVDDNKNHSGDCTVNVRL